MNKRVNSLIEIINLKTWFPIRRGITSRTVGHLKAVDGVTLHINRGETLGLVGESGCGKTTLGRTLMSLEQKHDGILRFNDSDLNALTKSQARRIRTKMQMIFQDPFSSLNPRMTVLDILTEAMLYHKLISKDQGVE